MKEFINLQDGISNELLNVSASSPLSLARPAGTPTGNPFRIRLRTPESPERLPPEVVEGLFDAGLRLLGARAQLGWVASGPDAFQQQPVPACRS